MNQKMQSKAERTKQFIIEKTASIFNAKGYVGTSLNDIMDATGLTKGSIYGNFENKDEVALEVFDYNFQCVISYYKERIKLRTSVIDKLMVYPETYRNFLNIPFLKNGCPIINTSIEADDTHPVLKAKAANALQFWRESLERHLKTGIDSGELKPDLNVSALVTVFISIIQGGVVQAKLTDDMIYLNTSMDFLEKMILECKA